MDLRSRIRDVPDFPRRGVLFKDITPLLGDPAAMAEAVPGRTARRVYSLEYGEDTLEIHADAFQAGQRALIVDDLLATGGTAAATATLVEELGAKVAALLFVIELRGLGGRERLAPRRVEALMEFTVKA
jgi:adenine phosphoribosyltransferase